MADATPSTRQNGDHLCSCPAAEYDTQLQNKLTALSALIPSFPRDKIEVFRSPAEHFRNRANFNVWKDKRADTNPAAPYYAMYSVPSSGDGEADGADGAAPVVAVATAGLSKKERKLAQIQRKVPPKQLYEVTTFPRGTVLINSLMGDLMAFLRLQDPAAESHVEDSRLLRQELFEARFVTTQLQQGIVVLIYHCPLDANAWCAAARNLVTWLQRPDGGVSQLPGALKVVGRARRQKLFVSNLGSSIEDANQIDDSAEKVTLANLEKELIEEQYLVRGHSYRNYQIEGAFSQPNAVVCQSMLTWSAECTGATYDHSGSGPSLNLSSAPAGGSGSGSPAPVSTVQSSEDLVELYCGGGTFTAPLSRNFRTVLATELSKASVVLAKKAFADNGITNVTVAPVSAEDFSGAYNKYLLSKRARPDGTSRAVFTGGNLGHSGSVQGITNLADFDNISTVFVDPPRAGCDDATCKLLARFDKICYISCNPETLARDIAKITAIVGPGTSSATNVNNGSDTSSTTGDDPLYRHRIVRVAAFDQFPYTPHLEGGVMLVKERITDAEAREGFSGIVVDSEAGVGEKRKAA